MPAKAVMLFCCLPLAGRVVERESREERRVRDGWSLRRLDAVTNCDLTAEPQTSKVAKCDLKTWRKRNGWRGESCCQRESRRLDGRSPVLVAQESLKFLVSYVAFGGLGVAKALEKLPRAFLGVVEVLAIVKVAAIGVIADAMENLHVTELECDVVALGNPPSTTAATRARVTSATAGRSMSVRSS